jgi:cell division protein FtsL
MNDYQLMNDKICALVLIESQNEFVQSLLDKIEDLNKQNSELKLEIKKLSNPTK